jgi:hypothetical protein
MTKTIKGHCPNCGADRNAEIVANHEEAGDLLGRKASEWLWDDAYGYGKFLRHEKKTQPARNWSALYQQRPSPETGNYFKAEWLKPYRGVS